MQTLAGGTQNRSLALKAGRWIGCVCEGQDAKRKKMGNLVFAELLCLIPQGLIERSVNRAQVVTIEEERLGVVSPFPLEEGGCSECRAILGPMLFEGCSREGWQQKTGLGIGDAVGGSAELCERIGES